MLRRMASLPARAIARATRAATRSCDTALARRPGRADAVRRAGTSRTWSPPARPREQPGRRRRASRVPALSRPAPSAEMARLEPAAVRRARRAAAAARRLHAVRAAAGRRGAQHPGVLRAPRGHPPGAAGLAPPPPVRRVARHAVAGPRPRAPRWSAPAGVPVVVRRTDTGETATLTAGGDPVEADRPGDSEIVLLPASAATRCASLDFAGPPARVDRERLRPAPSARVSDRSAHRVAGAGQRGLDVARSPACRSGRRWRPAPRPRRRRPPAGSARPRPRRRWRSPGR